MDILGFLKYLVFIQCPILLKALFIWLTQGKENSNEYRRRRFAELESEADKLYDVKTKDIKLKLFQDLTTLRSKDPSLNNEGKIRILEIGIGSGTNLQYYPRNCNLIGVDYNVSFEKVVRDKLKLFPNMTLEDFVIGSALNMTTIPSGSIDVVVSTKVFCSIEDINGLLKEIHRVLVPGGRFYYFEHILEAPNTFVNFLQRFLTKSGIWPFLNDGCQFLALDNILAEKNIFPKVEQENVCIDTSGFWEFDFLHTFVFGVKTKQDEGKIQGGLRLISFRN